MVESLDLLLDFGFEAFKVPLEVRVEAFNVFNFVDVLELRLQELDLLLSLQDHRAIELDLVCHSQSLLGERVLVEMK